MPRRGMAIAEAGEDGFADARGVFGAFFGPATGRPPFKKVWNQSWW